MEKILLIGGGGHCKVIINSIILEKKYEVIGIIDVKERVQEKILNVPIISSDEDLEDYFNSGIKLCFISVGSTGNPGLRIKLYNKVKETGYKLPNIVHPGTTISKIAFMGEGNFISVGVIINPDVKIGNCCIINTGAIIEHDCRIGNFVHIAPGVTLSGGVKIGNYSHIGTGAAIRQSSKIGKNAIIGAGSVVVKDIGDNVTAYGNPCRVKRRNDE